MTGVQTCALPISLPPYRDLGPDSEPSESLASSHSLEDYGEDVVTNQNEMDISTSLFNLSIKKRKTTDSEVEQRNKRSRSHDPPPRRSKISPTTPTDKKIGRHISIPFDASL